MIIYKITNNINSKVYIGQTIESLNKRWKRHNWMCTQKRNAMIITSALIKYGETNFKIEEIDTAENLDELNNKEKYYISFYNSISPNGYNIQSGGNNFRMSEETKLKISIANTGKKRTEETRNKLSVSHKGFVVTNETKRKLSETNKGKKPSDNTIKGGIEYKQKTFTLVNPDGELVTFTNMKKFCDENLLSNSKLCLVAKGIRNTHKGWTKPKEEY